MLGCKQFFVSFKIDKFISFNRLFYLKLKRARWLEYSFHCFITLFRSLSASARKEVKKSIKQTKNTNINAQGETSPESLLKSKKF